MRLPRPLALLGAAWCDDPSGDASTDLLRLLDALRPVHAARLAELPPQSQQVLAAIAERWDPIAAGPLSRALRMQVRLASAQLSRLTSLGFVQKVDLPQHARLGFQLCDRGLALSLLRGDTCRAWPRRAGEPHRAASGARRLGPVHRRRPRPGRLKQNSQRAHDGPSWPGGEHPPGLARALVFRAVHRGAAHRADLPERP
ncbi:MAG: hypothetical protein IPO67_18740 [Deltaproteobacteria bacterium]|nr:hypothetical protein [Deltaproteobacteria bacterium]